MKYKIKRVLFIKFDHMILFLLMVSPNVNKTGEATRITISLTSRKNMYAII